MSDIEKFVTFEAIDRIKSLDSWIQMFGIKNIKVDINRVARFAIYYNKWDLVRYLVELQDAQLNQRDKLGRSAVFYAAACFNENMLIFVEGEVGTHTIREEMSHCDAFGATPLYYAAMSDWIDSVEFCLFAGARPNNVLVARQSQKRSVKVDFPVRASDEIGLLFTLYDQLRSYGDLPVYHGTRTRLLDFLTDRPINEPDSQDWIHIPWTNVS